MTDTESISKFARELERYHPGLHEQISKEVIRRYVDREGNGAFANTAPSVSKRRLGEAGQDLLALVLQFRDTAAAKLSSFAILKRVLRDQFEIVDDECGDRDAKRAAIRDPKDVPCDTVGNPADPDASYNAHKGQGYMAQIVETYCEDDSNEAVAATPVLITHVEVHKMTVHDGHRLADALDDLSERALWSDPLKGLCCKLGEGAMRNQGASCSPYDSALARRSCSHAMASVRAHGPRPKARSTIRASPTMPPWRANIPAWPLRSARITSKPLIVA